MDSYKDDIIIEDEDIFTLKDRSLGDKRKRDFSKAISRRNKDISRGKNFKKHPWYNNLHQYSKNKIHCSCDACAFNPKRNGRLIYPRILPIGDKRRADSCDSQLKEYMKAV